MNRYYVIFSNADKAETTRNKKYPLTERCGLFIDTDNELGKAVP